MIKYLSISFHSFKQSVLHKPVALAMFILLIIMATVACGFSSRLMISEAESEIYPEIARIWCDEDADYVAIGDYMRSIENKYFNDYNDHGNILTRAIDIPVTFNEKSIIADVIELTFEVFNDKLSDKTIENGQKVMYANSNFCNLLGCEYGDNVTFCGEEILIIGVENSDEYDHMKRITMPYTIDLQKNISHSGGNPEDTSALKRQARLKIERLDFYGLQKNFDKGVYNDLKEIGVSPRSKSVNNALIQTVIMLVAFLIASSLSVISVTNYWQSVNAYKYNIYKTIGASPRRVAGIMLFETGIIASLAVAVGLLVDYIISLFVNIGAISRLLWLHYLVLFVATLLAVMVMVTIKIVRSAKRLPKEQLTSRRKRREKR